MERLNMHTQDVTDANVKKIGDLFPNCLTERLDKNGKSKIVIDFDKLKQELSNEVLDGNQERYQFTWPGKREAMRLANTPSNMTLRPDRESSVDFDNTENLYIEGDNLEVLKLLRENYLGKVKMIYIDPPYNTGNDFVYEDDFSETTSEFRDKSGMFDTEGNMVLDRYDVNSESNGRFHTDWLNMIYPRLKVAKDLLTDDGVIFISIDDNEVDNLRKVCDEVFGAQNFVATLIWQKRKGGGNDSRYIAVDHEYMIVVCKSILSQENKWKFTKPDINQQRYKYVDDNGQRYYWDTLVRNGLQNPIIVSLESPDGNIITFNSQWSEARVKAGLQDGSVRFTKTSNGWSLHHKVMMKDGQVMRSIVTDYGTNKTAGDELVELFGSIYFDYAKPSTLIAQVLCLLNDKNSIVLDFFSGSATTAHAVMKLNSEDGGQRKFLLVQLPEKTDEKSEAYKAGYKTICEIGKERIRRSGKKIKEELAAKKSDGDLFSQSTEQKPLDTGFRVLKLDTSNMQDVYYRPEDSSETTLFEDNVKPDRSSEDLLFQVMLECNLPLSAKIEKKTIAGKEVFNVNDGYLLACFDTEVNETVITEVAKQKPYYFIMRDASLSSDNVADNFEQIFNAYSKDTIRKIL